MVPSSARSHSSAAPANSSDNSSEGAIQTSQGTGEAVIAALRGAIAQLENSCEAIAFLNLHAADDAGESSEGADLRAQIDALQAELGDASELIEALQSQNDHLESERARADETNQMLENELSETQAQFAELEGLGLQTENLLQQFGLICDLQTADLWGQIVESACAVVGAEIGVLTDASAMDAVAMRGLGELSPRVAYELFEFTQSVRAQDAIIVENEAAKTPASCGFSNLIALPIAPGHPNGGVLLLANKDTGEFGAPDEFLLSLLQNQIVVALENARWKQQREELHVDTIAVLADAIETKDAENRGHCQSVMQLALDVARRMDIEGAALDEVRRAALLHDIGKVGVPDSILLNTGRLSDDEQTVMRAHAALGSDLVNDVPALQKLAPAILHHHEKWDGSGYPAGLAAENIPRRRAHYRSRRCFRCHDDAAIVSQRDFGAGSLGRNEAVRRYAVRPANRRDSG